MIISASRRTDIPNYYSEWFFHRLKEGYCYVRNPMNARQVSRIPLSPEVVDCIVFWTKNPAPMLARLKELEPYPFYFQFTLTGYGSDMERNVPHKKQVMIPVFQELSRRIGRERVIWRYDPILFNGQYTPEYHLRAFEQIAGQLRGYTLKCVVSFVDMYAKIRKNMETLQRISLTGEELVAFAGELAVIAEGCGMKAVSCAEAIDLAACGIEHNSCIDRELIERLAGYRIQAGRDRNQRKECGCVESVDVGAYDTCKNGCLYCYANASLNRVLEKSRLYDVNSPLLCGRVAEGDNILERKAESLRQEQLTLWDM